VSATPALLAAGFVHPVLLGGLALALAPILIHLLSRRQFRRIEWGAMRFLLEAERENRRRIRFEQWLLVALRCLALALIALLVARPFVQPGLVTTLLGGRGPVQRIVVLDDSASLAFQDGATPEFARLREAALRLLSWLGQESPGDAATLYLTSRPDEPLLAGQRLSGVKLAELRERLQRWAPVNYPARPRAVFTKIADGLASSRGVSADVYVLSDFQRTDWLAGTGAGGSTFAPLSALDPQRVRVILIASGLSPRSNVALADVSQRRAHTIAGLPAVVQVAVANYSGHPLRNVNVRLEAEGAVQPSATIEQLEAGATQTVSAEVTFSEPGPRELTVDLGAVDGFVLDNVRRVAVPAREALHVLLVNGAPSADPLRDEAYLARTALSPPGQFSSGVDLQVIEAGQLEAANLAAYDCVLLCNVPPPTEWVVAGLRNYVAQGGGLVMFLGDAVGPPQDYNRVFFADGAGLLPVPLGELVRATAGGVGLLRVGEHPVTGMCAADSASLSEYVRFRAYYRCLEAGESSGGQTGRPPAVVLARFGDAEQSPALLERGFGQGRVLLFASSIDLDWNDWARAPDGSYVVTLLELVQYAARRESLRPSFVGGERLEAAISPDEYEPHGVFESPAHPAEPAVAARLRGSTGGVGEPIVLEGPRAERLGTYLLELTHRKFGLQRRPLCVNLDAEESDLRVARAAELDAALGGIPHELLRAGDAFASGRERTRRELWAAVLAAVAVLLIVEQLLAWWFGRPVRSSGPRWLERVTVASDR